MNELSQLFYCIRDNLDLYRLRLLSYLCEEMTRNYLADNGVDNLFMANVHGEFMDKCLFLLVPSFCPSMQCFFGELSSIDKVDDVIVLRQINRINADFQDNIAIENIANLADKLTYELKMLRWKYIEDLPSLFRRNQYANIDDLPIGNGRDLYSYYTVEISGVNTNKESKVISHQLCEVYDGLVDEWLRANDSGWIGSGMDRKDGLPVYWCDFCVKKGSQIDNPTRICGELKNGARKTSFWDNGYFGKFVKYLFDSYDPNELMKYTGVLSSKDEVFRLLKDESAIRKVWRSLSIKVVRSQ